MQNNQESANLFEKNDKRIDTIHRVEDLDDLDLIESDGESVEMGGCLCLNLNDDNNAVYSYGAGPCMSGVVETNDNELFMMHSVGSQFTLEQEKIIKKSKRGVFGGNKNALEIHSDMLKTSNIKTILSDEIDDDFNMVFIKHKNGSNITPGLYYCYSETVLSEFFYNKIAGNNIENQFNN